MPKIKLKVQPPREVCASLATVWKSAAQLLELIRRIRDIMAKANSIQAVIKFGTAMLEGLLSEILSVAEAIAGSMAAKLADAVLDASSGIIKAILSKILSLLLQVVMAGPIAILSLVAIPLEQARRNTSSEEGKLAKAKLLLIRALAMATRTSQYNFCRDLQESAAAAIVSLNKAIVEFAKAIQSGDVLDSPSYTSGMAYMKEAVELTVPGRNSPVVQAIEATMKANEAELMLRKRAEIDKWYQAERAKAAATRSNDISLWNEMVGKFGARNSQDVVDALKRKKDSIDNTMKNELGFTKWSSEKETGDSVAGASKILEAALADNEKSGVIIANKKYQAKIMSLDSERGVKMSCAQALAKAESCEGIVNSAKTEFDRLLSSTLALQYMIPEAISEIGAAYKFYMQSHLWTTIVFGFRDWVSSIMADLQDLMKKAEKPFDDAANAGAVKAKSTCEYVASDLNKALNGGSPKDLSYTLALTMTMTVDHVLLKTSYSVNEMFGTKEWRDMAGLSNMLGGAWAGFATFESMISDIPDWDMKIGVWGVDFANSAESPYSKLMPRILAAAAGDAMGLYSKSGPVGDALGMHQGSGMIDAAGALATNMATGQDASFDGINELLLQVRVLSRHNSKVSNALNSWEPPMSDMSIGLKLALAAIGAAEALFSGGLSNMIAQMQALAKLGADGVDLGVGTCWDSYPELFEDPCFDVVKKRKIAAVSAMKVDPSAVAAGDNTSKMVAAATADYEFSGRWAARKAGIRNAAPDSGFVDNTNG